MPSNRLPELFPRPNESVIGMQSILRFPITHHTVRRSRRAESISRFTAFATSVFLLLAPATVGETISSELRNALLHTAFSENLIRHPQPQPNDAVLKVAQPNRNLHVNSLKTGIRWLLIGPIHLHQKIITHQDGDNVCNFEPSCSHYGLEAIRRHGLLGVLMTSNRLLRCYGRNHPMFGGVISDPVPPKKPRISE